MRYKESRQKIRDNRRDSLLKTVSEIEQIEILKWAEEHHIKSDDPLWILVEMLGYTERMTNSLPERMQVAGQKTVEAIAKQRKAETEAFTFNAYNKIHVMMSDIAEKVSKDAGRITAARTRNALWGHTLLVISVMLLICLICFIFGYILGINDIGFIRLLLNHLIS